MLFRTYREALAYHDKCRALNVPAGHPDLGCSWRTGVIQEVKIGGATLYRFTVHDQYTHRCKRCKAGNRNNPRKIACTGHICSRCGNPYANTTRRLRINRGGEWIQTQALFDSGILSH